MSEITVWSKPNCVQCRAVYRAFDQAGLEYEVKNLPDFPDKLEEFKEAGFASAPVVEAVGFDTFAGYNVNVVKAIIAAQAIAA